MKVSKLILISRPRFWIYLLGPFMVGLAAAAVGSSDLYTPSLWIFFGYFTFPANLLIYGVNDIFDYETDKNNPKKQEYEAFVEKSEHNSLWLWILGTNVPFWILAIYLNIPAALALLAFLFFGVGYSAKPIRAKAKPFLDSLFNILYIMPGLVGYFLLAPETILWPAVLAGGLWSMAMHSYSAIPDIQADRDSNTPTIATVLGFHGTLVYCTALYGLAYWLTLPILGAAGHVFWIVYGGMMLLTWVRGNDQAFAVYKLFPYVNTISGFMLFWLTLAIRFL